MDPIIHIMSELKDKGYRTSETRRHILTILSRNKKPISVLGLQTELKKKSDQSHITTLYRELSLLKKEGFVTEVQFGENRKLYELTPNDHHHHLVCTTCDDVQDISLDNDLDTTEKIIARTKKFRVASHSLEFFGTCRDCFIRST